MTVQQSNLSLQTTSRGELARAGLSKLSGIAIAAVGMALVSALAWLVGDAGDLFNSDLLLPVSYYHEYVHHPELLRQFQLPRIPSLFPDLLVYLSFASIFDDFAVALFAYSAAQAIAFVLLGALVVSAVTRTSLLVSVSLLVILLSAVLGIDCLANAVRLHHQIFTLYEHFSSLLMTLVGFLILLLLLENPTPAKWLALWLCCFLAFASNKVFAFTFELPLAIVAFRMYRAGVVSLRNLVLLAACSCAALVAAVIADSFLVLQSGRLVGVLKHLQRFVLVFPQSVIARPVAYGFTLFLPLAVYLSFRWLNSKQFASNARLGFAWEFAGLSMLGAVALCAMLFEDEGSYRYLVALYFWPIIFVAIVIQTRWPASFICRKAPGAAAALCAVLGVVVLTRSAEFSPWRHPLAGCLLEKRDRLGLKAGLADYWLARPVVISSNWTIQIEPMMNERYLFWGNNPYWYQHSIFDPTKAPEFNFIIPDRKKLAATIARFGPPDRVEVCAGHDILIYHDSQRIAELSRPD